MNSRALIRWSALHERRARRASWWASPVVGAAAAAAAVAGWVAWRMSLAPGDLAIASRAWLLACLGIFGVAFLRVPFHMYWRADSSLLAQLPVEGKALADAALLRSARGALWSTALAGAGTIPLAVAGVPFAIVARHLAFAGVFGVAAAGLVPAIVLWAASLVAIDDGAGTASAVRTAAGIDASTRAARRSSPAPILGAVPGGLGAVIIVVVLLAAPWLTGGTPSLPFPAVAAVILGGSAIAFVGGRRLADRAMARILRDVAALDRQRLASLEIRPPTALEQHLAALAGAGAIVYRKDAQLMRRRYPLAFALGAVIFLACVIIGISQPADPSSYLVPILVVALGYLALLARRLTRPPIELPRLLATLPIAPAAATRARVVWLAGWLLVFVAVPFAVAVVRTL